MITKEQFDEWRTHSVTIEIYKEIEVAKQRLQNNISKGLTIGQYADITHGLTNKVIGQIEGLNQLLNITYEDEKLIKE
ncbi:hypothetical protein [Psychroserpens sp.]